jgi:hypothetical protein
MLGIGASDQFRLSFASIQLGVCRDQELDGSIRGL